MSISSLTQVQRSKIAYMKPIYLVEWVLESTTLYLADTDWRYQYGSSQILYESYLLGISGIGDMVAYDSGPMNSKVTIEIANQRWSTYDYLSQLNDDVSFRRSTISVYELKRLSVDEVFSTDIRSECLKGKYVVEQLAGYDDKSFQLVCSSRLYNKRNSIGLSKINRTLYPYASPEDVGQYRNIAYGEIENIPCRCVYTGAIDLLSAYISPTATSITVQGIRRFEFQTSGVIQIGTELISYSSFSGNTFSGCTRSSGVSHAEDDAVLQVLSRYIYEAAVHPFLDITRVAIDDYDNTSNEIVTSYTGVTGYELAGYSSKAMVVVASDITKPIAKLVNKSKDAHTHTISGGTRYYPTTFENGDSAANLADWASSTYEYNWYAPNYDRAIINFHSASYVENAYPVDYHSISFSVMLDKQTTSQYLTGDFSFYWIDRDPVVSTLLQRLTLSQVHLLTIPAGTYLGEYQWFHVTLERPIRWRTGGIHQVSNANDNYVRIQTMYVTISEPRGRIATTVSGGSGTVGNLIDGDETTYLSLTQVTAATRSITMTPTAAGNRSTIKRLDVYALVDSNGIATTWGLYAGYLEGGLTKTLQGGIPAGQILSKGWVHFWFECDPDGLFSDWMLSSDGSVLLFLANGAGTCTIRVYEAYWNFEFEGSVSTYELTKNITADTIRGGLHTAKIAVGDEVTVNAQTRFDDASGTITGTSGALIERPDHIFKHLLLVLMNFTSGDIGTSFATTGTFFSSISYKFAFLVHDISEDAMKMIHNLAYQCRSLFCDWNGKFELKYIPDSTPAADFVLDEDDLVFGELPKFSESPVWDAPNFLTGFYNRDYRTRKRLDDPLLRSLDQAAASKGFKSSTIELYFGAGDIKAEITLNAIADYATALSVMTFLSNRNQTPRVLINQLVLKWGSINDANLIQYFSFDYNLIGTVVFRIMESRLMLEKGRIELKAESA